MYMCLSFFGILGQVWYLIASIPDLCTLTCFELQITQTRHPLRILDGKMYKFNNPKNKKIFIKFAQKGEAHVHCMNNHSAKLDY